MKLYIKNSSMGGGHSTAGEGSSSTAKDLEIYPLVIKKEPEDLTRRNLRQQVHFYQSYHLLLFMRIFNHLFKLMNIFHVLELITAKLFSFKASYFGFQ